MSIDLYKPLLGSIKKPVRPYSSLRAINQKNLKPLKYYCKRKIVMELSFLFNKQ
jgi:hypothetical protein